MGLSNEERYTKFFNGLRLLKVRFTAFQNYLERETEYNKDAIAVIQKWSSKVDYITGLLSRRLDSSSLYWVIGLGDDSFQGLYGSYYGLADQRGSKPDGLIKDYSVEYYKENEDIVDFAKSLTKNSPNWQREDVISLAHWWKCYEISGFLYYALFRYNDDCFPKSINDEITSLFGEMITRRFSLVANINGNDDESEQYHLEQVLLTKWKVFQHVLSNWRCVKDPKTGYYKEEKGFDRWKTEIRIEEVYDKVINMSLVDVEEYFKKVQDEKREQDNKYHDSEAKKKEGKVDGLVGAKPPRTEKELEEILFNSKDYQECLQASKDMEAYYGTFVGWEWRFKNGKFDPTKEVDAKGKVVTKKKKVTKKK